MLQEIYQRFLSNEEKWEERLKVIEDKGYLKSDFFKSLPPKSKSQVESHSPSMRESTKFVKDDLENNDPNESNLRPEVMNELHNSQMISPAKVSVSFVENTSYLVI